MKKRLFKLVFDFRVPSQRVLKYRYNEVVDRHVTQRKLRRVTIHYEALSMMK